MTFDQLKALDAVVKYGSIRAAAEKLHKTAPSISALIKNLESDVELELLNRDSYRPTLTEQGKLFYEKAKIVLLHMHELNGLSQRIKGNKELVINIAINAVSPLDRLLSTLVEVEKQHPETQLNVSTEHLGGAIERLKSGEVDIAITTSDGFVSDYMEASPAFVIPIYPVTKKDHPLAKIKGEVPRAEAAKYPQVIVRDSSRTSNKQTLDVIDGGRHCHVTDFLAKKKLLGSGLGWGGIPEYLIDDELRNGELVRINVEGYYVRKSEQYIIRRRDKAHGPVSQYTWDMLHKYFAQRLE